MMDKTTTDAAFNDGVYKDYLAHRKAYVDAELQSYRELDKWLITLAGTGMGLVFAFIKDIVPLHKAIAISLLPWSLGLMLFSVVVCLVSLLASCSASRSVRAALDDEAAHGCNAAYWQRVRDRQDSVWATQVTRHLNWIGVLSFVLGATLLISFIGANLPQGETKNEHKQQ